MNLRYIRTKLVKFLEGLKNSKKENRIIVKKIGGYVYLNLDGITGFLRIYKTNILQIVSKRKMYANLYVDSQIDAIKN